MAWVVFAKVNFRSSSGYVTDAAGQAYCLPSDAYPVTRTPAGGSSPADDITFGWSSSLFGDNLSTSGDVRVAGNQRTTSGSIYWRLDLPATGLYRIMAGGRRGSAGAGRMSLRDSTTEFHTVSGTFVDSTDILDLNSAVQPDPATWAANPFYVERTFVSTELRVYRGSADTLYASHVQVERWIPDDLTDVTFEDHFGNVVTAPTLHAGQPGSYRALKILLTAGTIGTSTWVFGGDLGAYFTTQEISGSLWAVCNGTRMPDSLAGAGKTLTVQQIDSGFVDPHTTNLTCTVVSSQGRDTTGWRGSLSTQNWVNRKTVLDKTNAIWAGYEGQAFSTDTVVTSTAELDTALAAIADGRTVWDRIQISSGTYTGQITESCAYGTGGGLLIEPAAGHDPDFNVEFSDIKFHGLHVRGLKMPGVGVGFYQFRFYDPFSASGINGTGKFNKVKFTGNRIGALWAAGQTVEDVAAGNTGFITMDQGESLEIQDNEFFGVEQAICLASGVRTVLFKNNDCRTINGDIFRPSNAAVYNSTQGVFADNHVYCALIGNRIRDEIDYAGWTNGVHPDTWQTGAFQGNIANWAISTAIGLNELRLNMLAATPAIYQCTVPGTTASSGTGPMRASQGQIGITDGTVVWTHIADYTTASNLYGVYEDNTMDSRSELSDEGTARQCYIDSNGSKNCPNFMSINNNAFGTESQYGLRGTGGGGILYAEFNTLASASEVTGNLTPLQSQISCTATNQTIMALHNIVQAASSNAGGGDLAVWDEMVIDWTSTASAPNRPADVLTGPFAAVGVNNRWGYPTLDETGTAAAFEADMRTILTALSGTAGIQADDPPPASGYPNVGMSLSLRMGL